MLTDGDTSYRIVLCEQIAPCSIAEVSERHLQQANRGAERLSFRLESRRRELETGIGTRDLSSAYSGVSHETRTRALR